MVKICANMLAESCLDLHPELEQIQKDCRRLCGLDVCLSGSGSAMYVLAPGPDERFLLLQKHMKKEYNCESRFVYNNRW